jgi:hypothetical protein
MRNEHLNVNEEPVPQKKTSEEKAADTVNLEFMRSVVEKNIQASQA